LPFASIAAFLLCLFGVILFTTMMLWAFNATIEQIRRATYITDLPWLDKVSQCHDSSKKKNNKKQ
jgi:hypothetical protein